MKRATKGYQVKDREPGAAARHTILGSADQSQWIERALGGAVEDVSYSSASNRRIYRHALKIQSADDMAAFQAKYGELYNGRSLSFDYGVEMIEDLRQLADGLQFERKQTLRAASKNGLFRGDFHIDPSDGTIFIKARSLREFMRLELWMSFATGRHFQECEYCGKLFRTGGQRNVARRADARYCSPSCRTMASRKRKIAEG